MKRYLIVFLSLIGMLSLGAITLDESIELARKNNKNLLMTAEEVSKAEAQYKDVRGSLLPQFSLQGQYGLSKTYLPDSATGALPSVSNMLDDEPSANDADYLIGGTLDGIMGSMMPSSPQDEGSVALQVKMDQVVFLGGKLINGIKGAARYRKIQKLNYQVQEQALILSTTELFYQVLLSEKVVGIQRAGLETARRHLARVELLSAEGQVSEFDVLRARLEVAKLEPDVLAAENTYSLALAAFKQKIGYEAEDLELEGGFILPPIVEMTLAEAQALGLENRTELELLDIATEIQQIRYNAEKGNYLPNVALSASAALFTAADEYAIQRDDFGTQYSVGIGFSLPIFTGFSNASKISYARHDLSKAKLQQRDTQELIALDIKQSHQKLQHALQNYEVQAQNIRLATRNLELAQIRYENQVGIQLEVFDAQIMLSSIQLQYYSAIYEVIVSERALSKAIGKNLISEK
ncbi:MAG: TolC family protein [Candidatus Cloacimonetes bacterium]|nr:TolC family protein [Candidatus Cloacimonadota bacterium]MCB5287791.1 TolC family protein [Candidatus Cloacimonadota bacterium]MCK9184797.1 TolC family protein [Candidatus Cloacimonadota bacterium]MDY0230112.1 TolC family protein [Candidatus Cloacimonadaceae bacterium]